MIRKEQREQYLHHCPADSMIELVNQALILESESDVWFSVSFVDYSKERLYFSERNWLQLGWERELD